MDEGTQITVEGDSVKVINTNPVVIYEGTKDELDGQISDLQAGIDDLTAKMAVLQTYKAKFSE